MAEVVLFCRVPGLLAKAEQLARSSREAAAPLVVAEGRRVHDACSLARARGITEGASVLHARRLCPAVLVVPIESVEASALSRSFLDLLADLSPEESGVLPCAALQTVKEGSEVTLAGLVLRPHRPPNAGGVVFLTLEDETGLAQVTVRPDVYERCEGGVFGNAILIVSGVAERRGAGLILRAEQTREL